MAKSQFELHIISQSDLELRSRAWAMLGNPDASAACAHMADEETSKFHRGEIIHNEEIVLRLNKAGEPLHQIALRSN